jgi:hypothetical protein
MASNFAMASKKVAPSPPAGEGRGEGAKNQEDTLSFVLSRQGRGKKEQSFSF